MVGLPCPAHRRARRALLNARGTPAVAADRVNWPVSRWARRAQPGRMWRRNAQTPGRTTRPAWRTGSPMRRKRTAIHAFEQGAISAALPRFAVWRSIAAYRRIGQRGESATVLRGGEHGADVWGSGVLFRRYGQTAGDPATPGTGTSGDRVLPAARTGHASGLAALGVVVVTIGLLVLGTRYSSEIDGRLAGFHMARDRLLPLPVRMALVFLLPIALGFLVVHGSLADLPALLVSRDAGCVMSVSR
jgi:hypothetical protein